MKQDKKRWQDLVEGDKIVLPADPDFDPPLKRERAIFDGFEKMIPLDGNALGIATVIPEDRDEDDNDGLREFCVSDNEHYELWEGDE